MSNLRESDWARLHRVLAETKARLAHLEKMMRAGKVRVIHVRPCVVKSHRRAGYTRVCYPARRHS